MKNHEVWRYIEEDGVSASFGLAADEYLIQTAGGGLPTLRLYTYRSHAALVGRFQNAEAEVNVEHCRQRGVAINRRPTGGGAIVMGADQLGVALVAPTDGSPPSVCQAAIFETCAAGLSAGLRQIGIGAAFRPKNDLEVGGKKIAGLALALDDRDTFLCHASLLVDFDVELMLAVLNLPVEKISDKAIASFEERLTTVRRESKGTGGAKVRVDDVRAQVREGFREVLGARFEPKPWTTEELQAIRDLESRKYQTSEWGFERTPARDALGTSLLKTSAGLLRVYVALSGETLKSVLVTGDFIATTRAVTNLEAKLKWTRAAPECIAETVHAVFAADGPLALGLAENTLIEALCAAIVAAKSNATDAS